MIKYRVKRSSRIDLESNKSVRAHQYKYCSSVKIKKNIYRSDVQVTFELYGHFKYLQVLYCK